MAAYIYASMSGEDSIWVVDADRFVPLRVIPLPRGSRPGSLACNPREGALYCACRESVTVDDSRCVEKSYPRFWEDLRQLKGEEL